MRPIPALLLLSLSLAACGGDSAPLTADDFFDRRNDAWCQRYADCGGASSYETCKQSLWTEEHLARSRVYLDQVAAGRILFDAGEGAACLKAFREASCLAAIGFEPSDNVSASCYRVFQPAQEEGEDCADLGRANEYGSYFRECKHGTTCRVPETCGFDQCCEGVCEGVSDTLYGQEGAACAEAYDCDYQFICKAGTCQRSSEIGDECYSDCIGDPVCTNNVCGAPAEVVDGVTSCSDIMCDARHFCGRNDGICHRLRAEGEACGPAFGFCDYFLMCSDETATCVPRRRLGETCTTSKQCLGNPSLCEAGVCAIPHALGDACSEDAQCISGTCLEGVCADWTTCATPAP